MNSNRQAAVTTELDPHLRNMIAETEAKIALLIMENNRIKYRIRNVENELKRAKGVSQLQSPLNNPQGTVKVERLGRAQS